MRPARVGAAAAVGSMSVLGARDALARAEWVGSMREPRQARSRVTVERIVAATFKLAQASLDGDIKLRDIAAEAGIAQGTLHTRFGSKTELLLHVHERFWAGRLERLDVFLTRLVEEAKREEDETPSWRTRLRPIFAEGLAALAEDLRQSRPINRVFELALIDSYALATQHRESLQSALALATRRAQELFAVLGAELDLERFRWTLRLVIAGLAEVHPTLASADSSPSDEVIHDRLVALWLEQLPP